MGGEAERPTQGVAEEEDTRRSEEGGVGRYEEGAGAAEVDEADFKLEVGVVEGGQTPRGEGGVHEFDPVTCQRTKGWEWSFGKKLIPPEPECTSSSSKTPAPITSCTPGSSKRKDGGAHLSATNAGKRLQQQKMTDTYGGKWIGQWRKAFFRWVYSSGIAFNAFRNKSWRDLQQVALQQPGGAPLPVLPSHSEIASMRAVEIHHEEFADVLEEVVHLVEITANVRLMEYRRAGYGYVLPWQRDEGMLDAQEGLDLEPMRSGTRSGMTEQEMEEQVALITRDPIGSSASPPVESVSGARAAIFRPYPRDDSSRDERETEAADDPMLPIPREIDELHEEGDVGDERTHTPRGGGRAGRHRYDGGRGALGIFQGHGGEITHYRAGGYASSHDLAGGDACSHDCEDLGEVGVHSGAPPVEERERRAEEHRAAGAGGVEDIRGMEEEVAGAVGGVVEVDDGAHVEREEAMARVHDGEQVERVEGVLSSEVERKHNVVRTQVEREEGVAGVDDGDAHVEMEENVVRVDAAALVGGEEGVVGGDAAHGTGEGGDHHDLIVQRFIDDKMGPALGGLTLGTRTALGVRTGADPLTMVEDDPETEPAREEAPQEDDEYRDGEESEEEESDSREDDHYDDNEPFPPPQRNSRRQRRSSRRRDDVDDPSPPGRRETRSRRRRRSSVATAPE
ncbi:hypothetical protein CBR_g37799 [Chara braunii]|uniref:Uncharacterized protein n=1 Tax=Chara braunii TaxID=69332 RepID=A0A388LNN4_CHABU|nr:hypothetical protein CBR_g37799 [Chara braunii]|eukprot:GBG83928.1 hypothetical protein CBR_g37799 [Chara braunii]